MEPIRILHVVPNMQAGGLETFIMNVYRNIDRDRIQFDFLVHYAGRRFYDDEIERLGGRIYRMTVREDHNLPRYVMDLNRFFKEHTEYSVVHGHMTSLGLFYFLAAKKNGVATRICHSHSSSAERSLKGVLKRIMEPLSSRGATVRFACSSSAGKRLYGKKEFTVVPNAVDTARFRYSAETRERVREQLHLTDRLVVGHIGRFEKEKNHLFLLDVFSRLKRARPDAVLLLVGAGRLYAEIIEKIGRLGLTDSVRLLDTRADVSPLYQAMDVFVLPSLFEGVPIVSVEAQCAGLPVVASDTVSAEACMTAEYSSLSLKKDAAFWAGQILEILRGFTRADGAAGIERAGYNLRRTSERLAAFYLSRSEQH